MTNKTSSRDKIMMGILALVVVAALWYLLFLTPTKAKIEELGVNKENYVKEDDEVKAKVDELKGWTVDLGIIDEADRNKDNKIIKKKLKDAKQFDDFKKIADYDNFEALSAEINTILGSTTESFSLSFEKPSREENCWRRDINISFKAGGRDQAKEIIKALNEMENGCFISDITFAISQGTEGESANVNCKVSIFEYEESEEVEEATPAV